MTEKGTETTGEAMCIFACDGEKQNSSKKEYQYERGMSL